MQKLPVGLAVAAAFSLFASASFACDWHDQQVTASAAQDSQSVAMSTYDGAAPVPIIGAAEKRAGMTACTEAKQDCQPPKK